MEIALQSDPSITRIWDYIPSPQQPWAHITTRNTLTRLFSPLRLRRGLCRLVTAVSRDTKGLGSISFIPVMSFDS